MPDYGLALGVKPIDIDVGKSLKTVADIQSSQAYTTNTLAESQKKMYDLSREEMGRAAKHLLMMPEGEERNKLYRGYVDDFAKKGYMQNHEAAYWSGKPASNMMLHQLVANSVPVATHAEIMGEHAGNAAGAVYPYKTEPVGPETSVVRPGQLPGAPQPQPALSGTPLPVRPVPTQSITPPTAPTNAAGVPSPRPSIQAPTPVTAQEEARNKDPIYKEVPKMPAPEQAQPRPGVAVQGQHPAQIEADKQAVEHLNKNILLPGSQASEQRANYNTLRTTLNNGINTGKAGPALATISGWMYAAGVPPAAIKQWTGTDPTQSDVLHKATIQESMKFVKDTIGARESLMAIQAITSAFPNLANTEEGNKIMVDIMDSLAEWKQDKAKYAGAFLEKNQHLGREQQMNAFNRWWSENHPAEQYVSKAMPRNIPRQGDGAVDAAGLQNGVTYVIPTGRDEKGKTIWGRGKWDTEANNFTPQR